MNMRARLRVWTTLVVCLVCFLTTLLLTRKAMHETQSEAQARRNMQRSGG